MNNTDARSAARRSDPSNGRQAFGAARTLLGSYAVLSAATLVVIFFLRDRPSLVTDAVWVRAAIVLVSALVTCALGARAARGSRGAYRRVRIISAVTVIAIAVIIALPGDFPLWIKLEQAVCGLLLLVVAIIVNKPDVRSLFA